MVDRIDRLSPQQRRDRQLEIDTLAKTLELTEAEAISLNSVADALRSGEATFEITKDEGKPIGTIVFNEAKEPRNNFTTNKLGEIAFFQGVYSEVTSQK